MFFKNIKKITYNIFLQDITNISSIEDPVTGAEINLEEYIKISFGRVKWM